MVVMRDRGWYNARGRAVTFFTRLRSGHARIIGWRFPARDVRRERASDQDAARSRELLAALVEVVGLAPRSEKMVGFKW